MNEYEEISAGGDDRAPAALRPRTARALSAMAAVAVLGYGGWRLATADSGGASVATPTAAVSSSAAAATPSFTASPPVSAQPRPQLPAMGESTGGTRLVLAAGNQLIDVGLDDGTRSVVDLGGRVKRVLPVTGGHVVLATDPAGPSGALVATFVSHDQSTVRMLGAARTIVPAASPDRIWLVHATSQAVENSLERRKLTGEIDVMMSLGVGRRPVRDTPAGMVTVVDKYFSRSLELFDWYQKRVLDTYFVGRDLVVVASNSDHVAYTLPACARTSCRLRIATVDAERVGADAVDVVTPDGWSTEVAEFSPDGTRIAMLGRIALGDATSVPAMLVADVGTGESSRLTGLAPSPERYTRLAWSPDGRWVFATAARSGAAMLGHRLGETTVRLVPDPLRSEHLAPGMTADLSAY